MESRKKNNLKRFTKKTDKRKYSKHKINSLWRITNPCDGCKANDMVKILSNEKKGKKISVQTSDGKEHKVFTKYLSRR